LSDLFHNGHCNHTSRVVSTQAYYNAFGKRYRYRKGIGVAFKPVPLLIIIQKLDLLETGMSRKSPTAQPDTAPVNLLMDWWGEKSHGVLEISVKRFFPKAVLFCDQPCLHYYQFFATG